jgi:PAS domain S-box-containing protein
MTHAKLLSRQLGMAFCRLASIERRAAGTASSSPQLIDEVIKELRDSLAELQVAHDQLIRLDEEILSVREALAAERRRNEALFELMADGYLVTDGNGIILQANRAAARLLNLSQRFLQGRPLLLFVGADRDRFASALGELRENGGERRDWRLTLRPRERMAFSCLATVAATREGDEMVMRWILHAAPESGPAARPHSPNRDAIPARRIGAPPPSVITNAACPDGSE